MKTLVLASALAAGLAAAAPASANAAGLSAGLSVHNGHVAGQLILVDHRNYGRQHRRGRFCQTWRGAHRILHRRYRNVQLQRRTFNRRGQRIFIVRAGHRYGYPLRVRYNACTHRVTNVTRLGRHGRGHQGRHHGQQRHRR